MRERQRESIYVMKRKRKGYIKEKDAYERQSRDGEKDGMSRKEYRERRKR